MPEPRNNIWVDCFVTDSAQLVDIIAVDVDRISGAESCRVLGTVLPEPGVVVGGIGRGNKGRFRFEVGKGNFQPLTRVYAAYSHHGQVQLPDQTSSTSGTTGPFCVDNNVPISPIFKGNNNGLFTGQYHAPMFTFQFADAPPGFPSRPNNFGDFPFLVNGEGATNPNPSAGPLIPQPPICPNVTSSTGAVTPTCQP